MRRHSRVYKCAVHVTHPKPEAVSLDAPFRAQQRLSQLGVLLELGQVTRVHHVYLCCSGSVCVRIRRL